MLIFKAAAIYGITRINYREKKTNDNSWIEKWLPSHQQSIFTYPSGPSLPESKWPPDSGDKLKIFDYATYSGFQIHQEAIIKKSYFSNKFRNELLNFRRTILKIKLKNPKSIQLTMKI